MAVFCAHVAQCVGVREGDGLFMCLEAIGRFGVILFFVHTSLVLMCSMERSRHEPAFAVRFYVRRIFRIYPLAVAAVLCSYLCHIPPNAWSRLDFKPISLMQLMSNLFLVQNVTQQKPILTVLWSLPLEVQMYVVLPFLFIMVEALDWRRRLGMSFIAAGIAAMLVWNFTGRLNLFAFIPCFLSGVLAYKRMRHPRILPGWGWPLLVLIMLVGLAVFPLYQRHFLKPIGILLEWSAAAILGFSWPMFREVSSKTVTVLAHQIAKYSYGIYLTHTYAMYLVFIHLKMSAVPGIALSFICTVVLSIAGYYLIEEPMINVGKYAAVRVGMKKN